MHRLIILPTDFERISVCLTLLTYRQFETAWNKQVPSSIIRNTSNLLVYEGLHVFEKSPDLGTHLYVRVEGSHINNLVSA